MDAGDDPPVAPRFARVVVGVGPVHLDRPFDYAIAEGQHVSVGSRVRVAFNGRQRTAWVTRLVDTPQVDADRVKPLLAVDGDVTWFDAGDVQVWRWVADRFAGTLSGAIAHALPPRVVRVEREAAGWPAPTSVAAEPGARPPCASHGWRALGASALLTDVFSGPADGDGRAFHLRPPLSQPLGPLLVDLVARTLAGGRAALVLTPGPAPGPAEDVLAAMGPDAVDLRRVETDADRYRAFLRIRRGDLRVVVGERGLALMPVPDVGLIVVVDEGSAAYKERRNPRHHAREAVLARGRLTGATVVLTSSLQSGPAQRLLTDGHLVAIRADRATERAGAPPIRVVDRTHLSPRARRGRLAGPVTDAMTRVVGAGGAVIVLAAARGSGSSLACTACRTRVECRTCGAGVAEVDLRGVIRWRCGVCGEERAPFPCLDCSGEQTFPLRAGAARLAAELAKGHPDAHVAHMEGFDQPGPNARPAIAVMTRGSVVARPDWLEGAQVDLLVVADPDVLLGRPDVDAAEDALRLWLDAAALAREVVVQTTQPTHPAVQALLRMDPDGFWRAESERREPLGFPPSGSLLRLTSLPAAEAAVVRRDVPGTLLGPDADGVALLKTPELRGTLLALRPHQRRWGQDDLRIRVEVDPVGLT